MLPASLAAELGITPEEMGSLADDIYSVSPGCEQVRVATGAVCGVIDHLRHTKVVVGHEMEQLDKLWTKMHILNMIMNRAERWFAGDTTPPGSMCPKDIMFLLINMCLHILNGFMSDLNAYGQRSKRESAQRHLAAWSRQLRRIVPIMLGMMPDPSPDPPIRTEDCHEGMGYPANPSSSLQSYREGEALVIEAWWTELPVHFQNSDWPLPTNPHQAEEGPEDVNPSVPPQLGSHDDIWTFRVAQTYPANIPRGQRGSGGHAYR